MSELVTCLPNGRVALKYFPSIVAGSVEKLRMWAMRRMRALTGQTLCLVEQRRLSMKIVKPLEECKRHDAHMAWREFMLEVGKMMIIVGANVTRAMDSGPEDAFYNPSAAIVRIMDDSSKPPGRGEGVAESLLDDFGVVSGSPFKEPDATVPMSMVDDDEPWMERYTKEYWDNLSMNHGGAAENAVEDVVVLGGVLEVVDGGAVEN